MIAYGWWMNHFPARPDRFFYRSIHADIGYAVLLLMVLRLIWRGLNPTPALPAGRRAGSGSRRGSATVRSMPSPSWWRCWVGRIPARARRTIRTGSGCFTSRKLPRPTRRRPQAYEDRHIFFAYVLLALIVIHLAAALWHHFVRRDRVTARMIDGAPG